MALQLLRSDSAPRRRLARMPNPVVRRRRRNMRRLVEAIRYGLARPDTESGRQARLLADIFGPQLGIVPPARVEEPATVRELRDVDADYPADPRD
jgi:hypothetical protein